MQVISFVIYGVPTSKETYDLFPGQECYLREKELSFLHSLHNQIHCYNSKSNDTFILAIFTDLFSVMYIS